MGNPLLAMKLGDSEEKIPMKEEDSGWLLSLSPDAPWTQLPSWNALLVTYVPCIKPGVPLKSLNSLAGRCY